MSASHRNDPFRMEIKRKEAMQRQEDRNRRSVLDQLKLANQRPGFSRKEKKKLVRKLPVDQQDEAVAAFCLDFVG